MAVQGFVMRCFNEMPDMLQLHCMLVHTHNNLKLQSFIAKSDSITKALISSKCWNLLKLALIIKFIILKTK